MNNVDSSAFPFVSAAGPVPTPVRAACTCVAFVVAASDQVESAVQNCGAHLAGDVVLAAATPLEMSPTDTVTNAATINGTMMRPFDFIGGL